MIAVAGDGIQPGGDLFDGAVLEGFKELAPDVLEDILGVGVGGDPGADEPHEPSAGVADDGGDKVCAAGVHDTWNL